MTIGEKTETRCTKRPGEGSALADSIEVIECGTREGQQCRVDNLLNEVPLTETLRPPTLKCKIREMSIYANVREFNPSLSPLAETATDSSDFILPSRFLRVFVDDPLPACLVGSG